MSGGSSSGGRRRAGVARRLVRRAVGAAQGAPACRRALRRLCPPLLIVPVTPADAAAVERLVGPRLGDTALTVAPGAAVRTGAGVEVEPRGWVARLRLPGGRPGPVAGYVELRRLRSGAGGDAAPEEWRLEALAVHWSLRGMGIASRLLREALGWARAAGCREVRLQVAPGNRPALGLYAREGFVAEEAVATLAQRSGEGGEVGPPQRPPVARRMLTLVRRLEDGGR